MYVWTELSLPLSRMSLQTVHPRMGYDMSDSIFMQEQQAAGKTKEAQRAQEEKSALEAFRAATLHAPTVCVMADC